MLKKIYETTFLFLVRNSFIGSQYTCFHRCLNCFGVQEWVMYICAPVLVLENTNVRIESRSFSSQTLPLQDWTIILFGTTRRFFPTRFPFRREKSSPTTADILVSSPPCKIECFFGFT